MAQGVRAVIGPQIAILSTEVFPMTRSTRTTEVEFDNAVVDGIYASVSDDGYRPKARQRIQSFAVNGDPDFLYAVGFARGRALREGARFHCEFTEPLNVKPDAILLSKAPDKPR